MSARVCNLRESKSKQSHVWRCRQVSVLNSILFLRMSSCGHHHVGSAAQPEGEAAWRSVPAVGLRYWPRNKNGGREVCAASRQADAGGGPVG